ncbi:glutaredoxin domain-containing protein [Caenimonas aquaedulcis]|uniref:DinB family protein n=1 Tax=Caenimonas aquaedulcis TaxID=2793270 RepID=A0A931H9B3_9BURK|nr:glutaredoxin domain-containing protein [Caenimonas aquaedulcis]MBG9390690.1 DinB family protein [Caenimonas aquaedulcis]
MSLNIPHPPFNPNRVRVYWQPGCTSCLRTKEFLTKQGIDYDSVNAQNNPEARAELQRLGSRSLPTVSLGDKYTLCQSFGDVLKFLNLDMKLLSEPLPAPELFRKLDMILTAAARYTRQFPADKLDVEFRERKRTVGNTCFHAFRVAEMGLEACEGKPLVNSGFTDLASPEWSFDDIADWGLEVRDRLNAWWAKQPGTDISYKVETYYGQRALHDVMDRTTYHCAQHTRQLMLMLEEYGVKPDRPITMEDLKGVPVPEAAWG